MTRRQTLRQFRAIHPNAHKESKDEVLPAWQAYLTALYSRGLITLTQYWSW